MNQEAQLKKILELQDRVSDMSWEVWVEHDFLTFKWWILLLLTVVPWIFWWFVVDTSRLFEILVYGLLWAVTAVGVDSFGASVFLLWSYPTKLLPASAPLYPADLTLVPVWYMMLYQYFSKRTSVYMMASVLSAAFLAFVVEPIFSWLNIFKVLNWGHAFSFLAFTGLAILFYMFLQILRAKRSSIK